MSMIGFPLLLIPLAIVNIIVFLMPGVSFTDPIFTVTLLSHVAWKVTFGDALLALSMLLLLFEVIKGARPGGKYFTDHLLALLVFAGAAAEFLLLPQFATSVFFLLTVLTLVDFLAGISLRLRRETRRVAAARAAAAKDLAAKDLSSKDLSSKEAASRDVPLQAAPPPVAAAPEPRAEPVLPPPMATIEPARPASGLVAPDVIPSRSDAVSETAAPDVRAPDLQPGSPSVHPTR
jgi:hypothetical protein